MEKGLSPSTDVEGILGEANSLEKKYEWLEASGLYEQALGVVGEKDFLKRGEVQERIGHCLHRAAFQAESQEEFKERTQRAIKAYEKAHGFYEKLADDKGTPWMFRCKALAKYLKHWIAFNPSEKRRLLAECLELEEGALTDFWNLGHKLEYGRTFNDLSHTTWFIAEREWDKQARRDALEKGVTWGLKAVEALSELDDSYEIARAHYGYALNLDSYDYYFEPEPEKKDHNINEITLHAEKAAEFSMKVGDLYFEGLSQCIYHRRLRSYDDAKKDYEKVLEYGEKTRDIWLNAYASQYQASVILYWRAYSIEDPDERLRLAEEAMRFYDRAQNYSEILLFPIPYRGKLGAPAPGGYAEYYWDRARWEVDKNKKIELLEKSEKAGLEALEAAKALDLPFLINRMYHVLSGTLSARASLELDFSVKRGYLERALEHREKNIEIMEGLAPFHYWNMGVYQNLLSQIQAELSSIQPDQNSKRRFLEEAVMSKEKSLENMHVLEIGPSSRQYATIYLAQDGYGTILTRLYEVTKDPESLRKAIDIWYRAIQSASELNLVTHIAESYWRIGRTHDMLGENLEAVESFQHASDTYMEAADKILQLKEFYKEYASYMRAWAEFEKAKHSHMEKRYLIAKEHYEKAAELHKSTERWSHLAPNYLAWARLGEAEDLSRREETEEAREVFQQATSLFKEAKGSIEIKLRTIQDEEERKLLGILSQASDIRCDYCLGRTALEEARILDMQGDHLASAREYGQATERFQKVIDTMEFESDRKELRPIVYLCQAWEKMMLAEARTSPEFYNEAAELFEQARKHALDQSTSLLAHAHSSFCKALEAGTRFERDRDSILFSTAKNHIEAATSQYLRAGYKTMSDYVGATSRLLDAYQYSYNAQTEVDTKKKAQFYQIAERLLQSSAGAYLKAKHPEKSEEVRRILERVKEEREIAVSLSEILHAPTIVSTTTSFSTPTPTHEQAVGLERFENADIQANLILRGREVKVGDDVDIEIELVNAGKAPAQLIKVEEIIPKGFEVSSAPDICRVEDSYLDMKGRTLMPLKTAELKIVLRPLDKGTFDLKPRILFLDEAGKYRSHEPEPATVIVKELGIKGWLRGPTR